MRNLLSFWQGKQPPDVRPALLRGGPIAVPAVLLNILRARAMRSCIPSSFRASLARLYHFVIAMWRKKEADSRVKYWEIIADKLSKAGWSWGWVSAVDCEGRTIWIADAHRGDGQRFVVHADEKLTAFIELESAIRACGE